MKKTLPVFVILLLTFTPQLQARLASFNFNLKALLMKK